MRIIVAYVAISITCGLLAAIRENREEHTEYHRGHPVEVRTRRWAVQGEFWMGFISWPLFAVWAAMDAATRCIVRR